MPRGAMSSFGIPREAITRLEHIYDHSVSAYAFTFRTPFGPGGAPTTIDQARVRQKVAARHGNEA